MWPPFSSYLAVAVPFFAFGWSSFWLPWSSFPLFSISGKRQLRLIQLLRLAFPGDSIALSMNTVLSILSSFNVMICRQTDMTFNGVTVFGNNFFEDRLTFVLFQSSAPMVSQQKRVVMVRIAAAQDTSV